MIKRYISILSFIVLLLLMAMSPNDDLSAAALCGSLNADDEGECPDSAFSIDDQLLLAVSRGGLATAKGLLKQGADINYRSSTPHVVIKTRVRADKTFPFLAGKNRYQFASGTAFDIALARYDTKTVKWLLSQAANPAAGYFANIINNTHFAGLYPDSYLNLPYEQRAKITAVGFVMEMAARENDVLAVQKLLALEPRSIHYRGNVILSKALQLGKWDIANLIIDQGSDVHGLHNYAGLFDTVMRSDPTQYQLLQKLLHHASHRKDFSYSALIDKVIRKEDSQAMQMLVSAGANLNPEKGMSPLFTVLNSDNVAMARVMLQLGADPNKTHGAESLLHRAIRYEKPDFVRLFLDHGAASDEPKKRGDSNLQLAMAKEDLQFTTLLIGAGADINRAGTYGRTPLIQAVEQVKPELVSLLLRSGAKVNTSNDHKDTALHIATRKADLNLMDLLLNAGADVNIRNQQKQTVLHIAVGHKNDVLVGKILQRGAKLDWADISQQTPLHFAVLGQNLPITRQLLNAGANPNTRGRFGSTPLLDALNWRRAKIARLLIDKGASLNVVSNARETPLDVANKRGLRGVAALIERKGGLTANEMGANPEHYRIRKVQ
ncbi:MAG: Unknown protein [uncultured Thiotrichaceae bacterium]|uniref:Uncharacterized protein n=1 Tax=uncultured Thiotrichaceae bacterium TaxID=298394 RepID=A0A6S6SI66_9GAMM|nr:MAG: Unknown protein [uncultured Thiotrichaceae bacterium]